MNAFRGFLSLYLPAYLTTLVYMLQGTEYQAKPYLAWFWRTNDFGQVIRRRSLDYTKPARMLLLAVRIGASLQVLAGIALILIGYTHQSAAQIVIGQALILLYPFVWAHALVVLASPNSIARSTSDRIVDDPPWLVG